MLSPAVSYQYDTHRQEENYIRAEMHEEEQRIDREQIEQQEAEENEQQWIAWCRTHQAEIEAAASAEWGVN